MCPDAFLLIFLVEIKLFKLNQVQVLTHAQLPQVSVLFTTPLELGNLSSQSSLIIPC